MGNRKNKHLNIFYHYSQAAADPIENNISRGLAIILDSNPFILDRLFDLVNNKISSPVSSTVLANLAMLQKIEKPQREYEVNIQMNTTQIEPEYSNILGITLTEAILVFCKTFLHNIAKKKYTPLRLKFFSDYFGLDRAFLSRKHSPVKLKMCA